MFGVGLAALIPLGSGADRWRLAGVCASDCAVGGMIYPLVRPLGLGRRMAGATGRELRLWVAA